MTVRRKLQVNSVGKPYARELHVRFDEGPLVDRNVVSTSLRPGSTLLARERFYLIKRRNRRSGGKAIYYCRFCTQEGELLSWKSTGQTTKTAAENWAIDHLSQVATVKETLTFRQYADGWWTPEHQYLVRKAARGTPISPSYAAVARSYLSRHILPRFGSERLDKITPQGIETWTMNLKEQISPGSYED